MRFQALRLRIDPLTKSKTLRRFQNERVGYTLIKQRQVVAQRPIKQLHVLRYHTDLAVQRRQLQLRNIGTSHADYPAVDVVQAQQNSA